MTHYLCERAAMTSSYVYHAGWSQSMNDVLGYVFEDVSGFLLSRCHFNVCFLSETKRCHVVRR